MPWLTAQDLHSYKTSGPVVYKGRKGTSGPVKPMDLSWRRNSMMGEQPRYVQSADPRRRADRRFGNEILKALQEKDGKPVQIKTLGDMFRERELEETRRDGVQETQRERRATNGFDG